MKYIVKQGPLLLFNVSFFELKHYKMTHIMTEFGGGGGGGAQKTKRATFSHAVLLALIRYYEDIC